MCPSLSTHVSSSGLKPNWFLQFYIQFQTKPNFKPNVEPKPFLQKRAQQPSRRVLLEHSSPVSCLHPVYLPVWCLYPVYSPVLCPSLTITPTWSHSAGVQGCASFGVECGSQMLHSPKCEPLLQSLKPIHHPGDPSFHHYKVSPLPYWSSKLCGRYIPVTDACDRHEVVLEIPLSTATMYLHGLFRPSRSRTQTSL